MIYRLLYHCMDGQFGGGYQLTDDSIQERTKICIRSVLYASCLLFILGILFQLTFVTLPFIWVQSGTEVMMAIFKIQDGDNCPSA